MDITTEFNSKPSTKHRLTEEMIAAMARLYRNNHPEKQWPTQKLGVIAPSIVQQVTGEADWPPEVWANIDAAGRLKLRGLSRSLPQILEAHGCHYNLTETMIVAMAKLYRKGHPDKQWPIERSGIISASIIEKVTGDSDWQSETWLAIAMAARKEGRGLTRPLSQIFEAHGCHYDLTEGIIVAAARIWREQHPSKKWPSGDDGEISPAIIQAVTGDRHWQQETWSGLRRAGQMKSRGLTRPLSQILDANCPERGKVQGPVCAS